MKVLLAIASEPIRASLVRELQGQKGIEGLYQCADSEYALNTVAPAYGGGFEVWRLEVPGMVRKHFYPRQPRHPREGAGDPRERDHAGRALRHEGSEQHAAPDAGADNPLWLLCGKHGVWFLEALSIEDRATYCFVGGEEVPALVSRLLCAPQFSREALYSPLSELTGESGDLAVPAQYLGFLVELRGRFKDRVIHQTAQGWKTDIAELAKSAAR